MSNAHNLPITVINHILTYDRRFVPRKGGRILLINKLSNIKYADVIRLLLNKPQIKTCSLIDFVIEVVGVKLTQNIGISYVITTNDAARCYEALTMQPFRRYRFEKDDKNTEIMDLTE